LVADVDCYRHFLPFCHASKVLNASRPNWKSNPGDGPVELEAELRVGFLGLEESYISRVLLNPYESVEVRNIPIYRPYILLTLYLCSSQQARAATTTPLFKTLITTWQFHSASPTSPHPSTSHIHTPGCRVSRSSLDDGIHANQTDDLSQTGPTLLTFDIVFAFANPLHASVSSAFFGRVSRMMVGAFEERCLDVYGLGTR
jgi:coenzyme Q-binding protein COQ10